jgi:hypothetical protein
MVVTARDEIAGVLPHPDVGDLGAAARVYQTIRAQESDQADALHRLGMGRYQQGRSPDTLELIGKAVALPLDVAAPRADLAGTYRASITPSAAAAGRRRCGVTTQRPGSTSVWPCKASAGSEADEPYRAALALGPDDALFAAPTRHAGDHASKEETLAECV